MYKIMALDIGTKRIGIALSDFLLMLAQGHSYIPRQPEDNALKSIYEIAKTYDINYQETTKIGGLMTGSYLMNTWKKDVMVDFYLVKGIIENVLCYMGYNGRYSFVRSNCSDLHPGVQAHIVLDGKEIGIVGKAGIKVKSKPKMMQELQLIQ